MEIEDLAQDVNLIENGVWVLMDEGYEVKIRSSSSDAVRKMEQRQLERDKRFYRKGKMVPLEIREKNQTELLCEAVVLDWRGIEKNKKPLKWSVEGGYEILGHPKFRQMASDIVLASQEISLFVEEGEEEDLGNSKAS